MPEGPECRIITDQLHESLVGKTLRAVTILSGRYERHGDPKGLVDFSRRLPLTCLYVSCKGKFIHLAFQDQSGIRSIWNTLGMTGYWARKQDLHARVRFEFDSGDLYFCDARNFGTLSFDHTEQETMGKIGTLGIDLLAGPVNDELFKRQLLKRKKKTIVETLMDQSITAGVGNYIKCEALYHSGISPHRVTDTLTNDEFKGLQRAIVHVMASSYASKGHTMSDFRDIDGSSGSYKYDLAVYNKGHDPKGNPVRREETRDGRTTHWVPVLQK